MNNDKVFFETINGKKIFTSYSDPVKITKKIVIMSHGFRGSSVGPARTFVDFSRLLVQNGYSTLRFDQPNSGNSEGNFLESSFSEWVETTTYFAKKYLKTGYKVALLGQSMGGATSSYVAADLQRQISCMVLWAPGISDSARYKIDSETTYEEGGQKYRGSFWNEERKHNIFEAIEKYQGAIHLVFGESDKYTTSELREQLIGLVRSKGQIVTILKGQDHSPWDYDVVQKVYQEELEFLNNNL